MAFVWRSRIRFVDTDASGRIHYTALFRQFEAAEEEFFRSLGVSYSSQESRDLALPRVHVEADYSAALCFDDEIDVLVEVKRVGEKSYTLGFQVMLADTGEEAARGSITAACMSKRSGRSHPLPEPLREALQKCKK
jgi:YbgC/YbaW family acyl-CoA thioester hydrolase